MDVIYWAHACFRHSLIRATPRLMLKKASFRLLLQMLHNKIQRGWGQGSQVPLRQASQKMVKR